MSYEYRSDQGLITIVQVHDGWQIRAGRTRAGHWPRAEDAVDALASRASGLKRLDRSSHVAIPTDLLSWTPTGEHL